MINNKNLLDIDINLLSEKLRLELQDLSYEIKNKIIINKKLNLNIPNSKFSKYIKSKKINELENKLLSNICINDKSYYELSTEIIIDGYICRMIPIGTNIYKCFKGFLTENQINNYSKNNLDKPSWMTNKYSCYYYARNNWLSIVSFKVIKPIYLIDYFNLTNLTKIFKLIKSLPENIFKNFDRNKFLYIIKYTTGFNISLKDQILFFHKYYDWEKIYVYTDDYNETTPYNYCFSPNIGLSPIYAICETYNKDIFLFKKILKKYINIDGLIRRVISSNLDLGGKYNLEELLIKNKSILNNMIFDYNDKLNWINWKIKKLSNYNYQGLHIKSIISNAQTNNKYFKLIKYYLENNFENINLNKKKYIMLYNINNFINLNFDISYIENMDNILNLIKLYHKKLQIIVFFKYYFKDDKSHNYFIKFVKKYNFKLINKNENILILSKQEYDSIKIDISLNDDDINYIINKNNINLYKNEYTKIIYNKIKINIIILDTNYGLIAFIYILIKDINIIFKENIDLLIFNNIKYDIQICILNKILKYKPYIIIGNFNFTLKNKIIKYLKNNNYFLQSLENIKLTSYNPTNYCFIKNKYKSDNIILKCNYSDHLPMFQSIKCKKI